MEMDTTTRNSMGEMEILCREDANIWCPLPQLYISGQKLIARHPQHMTEEVLTIYCPRCFTRYFDGDENSSGMYRHCSMCLLCPHCDGVVSKSVLSNNSTTIFTCSNCYWTCSSSSSSSSSGSEGGGTVHSNAPYLNGLIDRLSGRKLLSGATLSMTRTQQLPDLGGKQSFKVEGKPSLQFPSLRDRSLEPRPVPLLSKRTLRGIADPVTGRGGIIFLPKALPLEGDSSQVVGKGKWFEKSVNAALQLPRITLLGVPGSSAGMLAVRFVNPLPRDVTLKLSRLEASAEPYAIQDGNGLYASRPALSVRSVAVDDVVEVTLPAFEDDLLRDEARTEVFPTPPADATKWRADISGHQVVVFVPLQAVDDSNGWETNLLCEVDAILIPMKIVAHCVR